MSNVPVAFLRRGGLRLKRLLQVACSVCGMVTVGAWLASYWNIGYYNRSLSVGLAEGCLKLRMTRDGSWCDPVEPFRGDTLFTSRNGQVVFMLEVPLYWYGGPSLRMGDKAYIEIERRVVTYGFTGIKTRLVPCVFRPNGCLSAVDLPFWIPLLPPCLLLAILWHSGRKLKRTRSTRGLCPNCGYDIRNQNHRCPECGVPLTGTTTPPPGAREDKKRDISAPAEAGEVWWIEEPYGEGVASHTGPESCVVVRKGCGRSVDRGTCGLGIEPRNPFRRIRDHR
jgi:hypothetical protein